MGVMVGLFRVLVMVEVAYFIYCFEYDRAHENAKIGAHNVHEANDGRIFAIVNHNVRILEYEKRLQKYKQEAEYFGYNRHSECSLAIFEHGIVRKVGLHHLYETKAAVDERTHGKYGRAYAHVQLARAVFVVVREIEFRQVGRGRRRRWYHV